MFNISSIPSQKGRIAIVTGANVGLGYETTLALAKKEVKVIMACRNIEKAEVAKKAILKEVPNAALEIMAIDLSSLASVRSFAVEFSSNYNSLDLLINNAGVMIPPFSSTKDGFELQMGANYFGHFLLTGLLIGQLNKTPESRIVSLSSIAHKSGKIDFDNLNSEKKYARMTAYSQSKLACLMFSFELQRRLEASKSQTISVAAHPGVSNTNLSRHIPKWLELILKPLFMLTIHEPKEAAKPTLLAALGPEVKGGQYFGPKGYREMNGLAGEAFIAGRAKNEQVAKKLWEESERLTGNTYL